METADTHRNGKPKKLVRVSSLPGQSQRREEAGIAPPLPAPAAPAAAARQTAQPPPARSSPRPPDRIPLTPDGFPDEPGMLAAGMESHLATYRERMRAVATLKERLAKAEYGERSAVRQEVAAMFGKSASWLSEQARNLEEIGPCALVPGYGLNRGEHPSIGEELGRKIRAAYLTQERRTVQQVYRDVVKPHCQRNDRNVPHVSTVRRYLADTVTPLMETAFREGKSAYLSDMAPKVVRDLETAEVNEIWCGDHRLWDIFTVCPDGKGNGWTKYGREPCPCGSGRERRKCCSLVRPYVTLLIDVRSALIVAWRIGKTPTAAGVAHAFRSGVLKWGLPRKFYRDNGREFTAKQVGGPAYRDRDERQTELSSLDDGSPEDEVEPEPMPEIEPDFEEDEEETTEE
ncbi:MAG: integrase catalytic domain-containing protein [Planctomycetota bacterium]